MKKFCVSLCLWLLLLSGCVHTAPTETLQTSEVSATVAPTPEWFVTIPGITEPTANSPCQGPQWAGLTFRKTTEAELVEWLKTSAMVDQDSLVDAWHTRYNIPSIHYYSWLIQSGSQERGVFNILNDTVYSFYAPVMYPLDLEQMVAWWGEPASVTAYMELRTEKDCTYAYEMAYPERGMMVTGVLGPTNAPCEMLEEDTATGTRYGPWQDSYPVTHIYCSALGDFETLIENVYVTDDPKTVSLIASRFHPWTGWGRIELSKE